MSQRDFEQNKDTLSRFQGRSCFASLATNSVRLRFDAPDKQGCYLWIDPPWIYSKNGEKITSSADYSEATFKEWCQLFSELKETIFEDFEIRETGDLTLAFTGGYQLCIPDDPESDDPESDYDQWYAYDRSLSEAEE